MNFVSVLAVVVSLSHYATAQCPNGGYMMKTGDTILSAVANNNPYAACAWINANGVDPCTIKAGQCLTPPSAGTSTTCPAWCSSACCPNTASWIGPVYSTYGSYGYGSGSGSYGSGSGSCGNGQYAIQSGNTFYGLGGQTNAGTCAWLNANPNVNPCNLQAGQCVNQPSSGTSTFCNTASYSWYNNCGYSIPTGSSGTYYGPYYNGYNGYNGSSGYSGCNCAAGQYCVKSGDSFCAIARAYGGSACDWMAYNGQTYNSNLQINQCLNNPVSNRYYAGYCSIVC